MEQTVLILMGLLIMFLLVAFIDITALNGHIAGFFIKGKIKLGEKYYAVVSNDPNSPDFDFKRDTLIISPTEIVKGRKGLGYYVKLSYVSEDGSLYDSGESIQVHTFLSTFKRLNKNKNI